MAIDLDGLKPTGPLVPVAPMMGTGGSPYVAAHGLPKTEARPVAPFPDMGAPVMPPSKPAAAAPFPRVKSQTGDQKRQSPKQTRQPTPKQAHKPAPKASPASGMMAHKPNPMATAPKQAPKPPAPAPPAAPAAVPAPVAAMSVALAAPMAPVAATQPPPHFTNATFTLDPMNHSSMVQKGGVDNSLDIPMGEMDAFGPGDAANNDATMDDLDHFFDIDDTSNANDGTSDFNDADYMNSDFNFGFE